MNSQLQSVVRGPFKGLIYPTNKSVGSSFYPKILGTYESELIPLIEKLCMQPYTEVIDVGCAEGYYANGFALRQPQALIYAFDINEEARILCSNMSKINGLNNRVIVRSECNPFELCNLPYRGKSLIISDCEGYELDLFTDEVLLKLAKHDFLIETHDFYNINISIDLENKFIRHGFTVSRIESIDDIKKARTYVVPEIAQLSLIEKFHYLKEGRPHIMEWLFCSKVIVR